MIGLVDIGNTRGSMLQLLSFMVENAMGCFLNLKGA